jgi:hypothetical protein
MDERSASKIKVRVRGPETRLTTDPAVRQSYGAKLGMAGSKDIVLGGSPGIDDWWPISA